MGKGNKNDAIKISFVRFFLQVFHLIIGKVVEKSIDICSKYSQCSKSKEEKLGLKVEYPKGR